MTVLDYPVAAPEGISPVIFRAQILQNMALRYQQAVSGLDQEEARDAAMATWETDWETDPKPRTLEAANEAVDSDLEHWGDD